MIACKTSWLILRWATVQSEWDLDDKQAMGGQWPFAAWILVVGTNHEF